jgi:pimeloyl-ACP methyl ester carboxylesterase
MTDLRGYGDSSKPPDGDNHVNYSKRAMALDQVEVMRALGFERFAVVGHDRGGAVTWRLAVEHPDAVTKAVILDIVPSPYSRVTRQFATEYFHWFFLIQPAPFPETLIGNSAEYYLRSRFQRRARRRRLHAGGGRGVPAVFQGSRHHSRDLRGLPRGATIDLDHARKMAPEGDVPAAGAVG